MRSKQVRKVVAGVLVVGAMCSAPFVTPSWSGDPDIPGAIEYGSYAERCHYIGDFASCTIAWMEWFLNQSLL